MTMMRKTITIPDAITSIGALGSCLSLLFWCVFPVHGSPLAIWWQQLLTPCMKLELILTLRV